MAEEPEVHSSSAELQHQSSSSSHSEEEILKKRSQAPFGDFASPDGDIQMLPVMYPTFFPGFLQLQPNQEQINQGPGLYAVPPCPFMGSTSGYMPNTLIPFTYNLPTGQSASETRAVGEDQGQLDQQQQPPQQLQPAAQRQVVVRRFQIAFQLDLLLIVKLMAVIFLFNQDGSRQRLVLLVFFAALVYLYQTGALAPLVRWLSQGMQRAAAPPHQPPRPAVRADNVHDAGRAGNENAPASEGQLGGENENQPVDGNRAVENEAVVEPGQGEGGNHWWVIVKEVQMIVFGFITSLLPGFQNID